jgi:hypothetical protein
MMIMYDTPTPKHLIAIAASNTTAAFGYVICESAKKEDVPLSRYRAQRAWRYNPKAEVSPHHRIRRTPSMIPKWDMAEGMASVPAPMTVSSGKRMALHVLFVFQTYWYSTG